MTLPEWLKFHREEQKEGEEALKELEQTFLQVASLTRTHPNPSPCFGF